MATRMNGNGLGDHLGDPSAGTTANSLQTAYPWTSHPLISNAPMGGFAGGALAAAVSNAGGLGFIGAVNDMQWLSSQLEEATRLLESQETTPTSTDSAPLPIGVGFLAFAADLEDAAAVVHKYRPTTVWLAAPKQESDYALWATKMRSVPASPRIWIQTGSVDAAVRVARTAAPDVLVMQGIDAGGHGLSKGAGVVALLPETADALQAAGFGHIPLVAAGGLADGRGVAAALALGAQGVVLGTRFLASREIVLPHAGYQRAVLAASDGGQSTIRATVFDEMRGPNIWPSDFDGRAIVNASYKDFANGVGIEEIRKLHKEASLGEDKGFVADAEGRRVTIWSGTGVGIVKEVMSAGDIVKELRKGAQAAMSRTLERL